MTQYRVVIEASVARDLEGDAALYLERGARDQARVWFDSLEQAINVMQASPLTTPEGWESLVFQREIRFVIAGIWRFLFLVKDDTLHILHVASVANLFSRLPDTVLEGSSDPAHDRAAPSSTDSGSSPQARNVRTFTNPRLGFEQPVLLDVLRGVLEGNVMSIEEASNAVLQTGYKSTSHNFHAFVASTLSSNKQLFRRVAHGRYTVA